MSKKFLVITTINEPTKAVRAFGELKDWTMIIVGDRKSPAEWDGPGVFLDIDAQKNLGFKSAKCAKENHYSRKNLGYLYAMREGAEIIADADDDNCPLKNWGCVNFNPGNIKVIASGGFYNVFSAFSRMWPRGYPLEMIDVENNVVQYVEERKIGVWQHFVNHDPDVDAIYRMTCGAKINWPKFDPFCLEEGTFSPFNSQNTFWRKETFPLMYLPQTVNQRFSDILRGYIAQKAMWDQGLFLGFGPATVRQDRNQHDLFNDFLEEIPMYKSVRMIAYRLLSLKNTSQIYALLNSLGIIERHELSVFEAWTEDVEGIYGKDFIRM